MCSTSIFVCLLLSAASLVPAARKRNEASVKQDTTKCTIEWKYRDQVASVSFGTSKGCMIGCKATFTDHHYNKKFVDAFEVERGSSKVSCRDKSGAEIFAYVGKPDSDEQAKSECFEHYKTLATDELKKQWEKETLLVVHHSKLYDEKTFEYTCEAGACKDGQCDESTLPSLMAGRNTAEKQLMAKLMQDLAHGKVSESNLDANVLAMVNAVKDNDLADLLLADMVPDNEQLTVRTLKDKYEAVLKSTGLRVGNLLKVAGLTASTVPTEEELDKPVSDEEFRNFLEPDCP